MQEMETSQLDQGEEDFIDIEVTPFSNPSKGSPPQSNREFEFQMCSFSSSSNHNKEATTPSPADELFYNGKLLPLYLPPRLQMVQSLLSTTTTTTTTFHVTQNQAFEEEEAEASRSFTAPPTTSTTPLESCNISPVESCRVSCELNPDEYFFHWSTGVNAFIGGGNGNSTDVNLSKKAWCKKIRLIKQSSVLTQKLKSSRAYLKSLFMRSSCSDEANCANKPRGGFGYSEEVSRAKECVSKYIKLVKRNPFGQMENDKQQHQQSSCTMKAMLDREMDDQVSFTCHRKSFSGAIKRHCTSKCYSSVSGSGSGSSGSSSSCSSSSSSFSLKNAHGICEMNVLKRSISANSEVENSIQGAIAHCKKSQCSSEPNMMMPSSEIRPCLVSSASRVAACGGVNGRLEISRI